MDTWVLWVVVACAFGALISAAAAEVAGMGVAVVVFVLASILTLAVVRPVVRSHLRMPPHLRTGAAALVGKQAIVLETIANDQGVGIVRIDGEVWTARSLHDDQVIERGTRVEVIDIKGATALVTE
jgi:membrane protein implicated in regulation of membrane protease activity